MIGVKRSREEMYVSIQSMTPAEIKFYNNMKKDIESLRGCKNLDYISCLAKDFDLLCWNSYPESAEHYLCKLITDLWDEADAPYNISPFEWTLNMKNIDDNYYNKYCIGRNNILNCRP